MQNETVRAEAQGIVDYAMRKGEETLFVNHEHYPAEYVIQGDFLTGLWDVQCYYTKEEAPYCWKQMSGHLLGKCKQEEAIVRVVELLKGGGIIV